MTNLRSLSLMALALGLCSCTPTAPADRISELEAERASLIDQGLGPGHPRVRQIDEGLENLNQDG